MKNLTKEILQTKMKKNWTVGFIKRHFKYIYSIYLSPINNTRISVESLIIFKYFYTFVQYLFYKFNVFY